MTDTSVEAIQRSWRCFHCDDVFHDEAAARGHFGPDEESDAACRIKAGAEGSLVNELRRVEGELHSAWRAIHDESTEAAKAYYAQQTRHGEQLTAAEELGYERGLADGRASQAQQIAALRSDVIAFCGPWAVQCARDHDLPDGHLHPTHYDILEKCGARMDSFTRAALSQQEKG